MSEREIQKRLRKSIYFIVCIGILMVSGCGIFAFFLSNTLEEAVTSNMRDETDEYKKRLHKQLDTDLQLLNSVAEILGHTDLTESEAFPELLDQVNQSNDFLTMSYINADGIGIVATLGKEIETGVRLEDLQEEPREIAQKALNGEECISHMFKGDFSQERVFTYGVPVYRNGVADGALLASTHVEIFSDILSGNTVFGGGGYIHLLDQEGNFLAKSSKTVVRERTQSIFDGPYLSESARNEVKEAMERQERISASFDYEGKSYPFLIEPVGLNGWYLFCVNTGEGLGANSNAVAWVTQIVFIGILLMILFLMLYGYRLLHKYNENLIKLAYYDSQIEAENLYRFRQRLEKALADGGGAVVELCIRQYSFLTEIFGQEKTIHLLRQIREVADRRKRPDEFF